MGTDQEPSIYFTEARAEIQQCLREAFTTIAENSNSCALYRLLDVLTRINQFRSVTNQFCPQEIWKKERLDLAASALQLLPPNFETGKILFKQDRF